MNHINKGTLVPGSNPAGSRAIVFMYLNSRYHFCFNACPSLGIALQDERSWVNSSSTTK